MQPSRFSPVSLNPYDGEQIDVLRIRLWNSKTASAVLSDFYSTERVIANWAKSIGCGAVRFQVTFIDGYVVEGCHEFFKKAKRTCSFSTHLRRMMRYMEEAQECPHLSPARNSSRYEIPAN